MIPFASSVLIVSARTAAPVASSARIAREAENDDANVADLGYLEQESVCGSEEERPIEPVGDDVLVEQCLFLLRVVAGIDRGLVDDDRKGHLAQGIEPCNDHPRHDSRDQVEGDRRRRGGRQDERIPASSTQERADARHLDHLHDGRDQHPGERRERDPGNPAGGDENDEQERK